VVTLPIGRKHVVNQGLASGVWRVLCFGSDDKGGKSGVFNVQIQRKSLWDTQLGQSEGQ